MTRPRIERGHGLSLGLPYMTSADIMDLLTLSLSAELTLFVRKFGLFLDPPLHLRGRHTWEPSSLVDRRTEGRGRIDGLLNGGCRLRLLAG